MRLGFGGCTVLTITKTLGQDGHTDKIKIVCISQNAGINEADKLLLNTKMCLKNYLAPLQNNTYFTNGLLHKYFDTESMLKLLK